MAKHITGTCQEWLAARLELLEAGKTLTRQSDEVALRRQVLPWVAIDREETLHRFPNLSTGAGGQSDYVGSPFCLKAMLQLVYESVIQSSSLRLTSLLMHRPGRA